MHNCTANCTELHINRDCMQQLVVHILRHAGGNITTFQNRLKSSNNPNNPSPKSNPNSKPTLKTNSNP